MTRSLTQAASSTDQLVGTRLRECRTALGISVQQFSERIGVTYQRVLKYERAIPPTMEDDRYQALSPHYLITRPRRDASDSLAQAASGGLLAF